MYLMWITSIPLLVIKTNHKPSDIILITYPLLLDSEEDLTCRGRNVLGQTLWCEYKASGLKGSYLSASKSLKKHYVKYNYETVLLAQCRGWKFLAVAKSIKFCLTWILLVCEVMRKVNIWCFRNNSHIEVMYLIKFADTMWHSNSTDYSGFQFC